MALMAVRLMIVKIELGIFLIWLRAPKFARLNDENCVSYFRVGCGTAMCTRRNPTMSHTTYKLKRSHRPGTLCPLLMPMTRCIWHLQLYPATGLTAVIFPFFSHKLTRGCSLRSSRLFSLDFAPNHNFPETKKTKNKKKTENHEHKQMM